MAEILYESPAGILETVVFDVLIRESHVLGVELPRHPVEASADRNDHARILPEILTLEVGVTNKPTRVPVSQFTGEPILDFTASFQSYDLGVEASRAGLTVGAYNMTKAASAKSGVGVFIPLPANLGSNLGGSPPDVDEAQWALQKQSINASLLTVSPMDRVRSVFERLRALRGVPVTVLTSIFQYDSIALRSVNAPIQFVGYCAFQLEFEAWKQAETAELVPDPTEARARETLVKGSQAGYALPATQVSAAGEITGAFGSWLQRDTVAVP